MTLNQQKTAIVTGASRGLGLALSRRLANEGYTLVIDARGDHDLMVVEAELSANTTVTAIVGSVADEAHRQELIDATHGRLDLLVNNASVLGPSPQPHLAQYPLSVLEEVYRVNVLSPLGLIQLALPLLRQSSGTVINITSDAAAEPYDGWGGYGSSKAALEQISQILAEEEKSVRVYWVDPGDMNTRMHQEAYPGEDISDRPSPEESVPGLMELINGSHPSGRYSARALQGVR